WPSAHCCCSPAGHEPSTASAPVDILPVRGFVNTQRQEEPATSGHPSVALFTPRHRPHPPPPSPPPRALRSPDARFRPRPAPAPPHTTPPPPLTHPANTVVRHFSRPPKDQGPARPVTLCRYKEPCPRNTPPPRKNVG